MRNMLLLWRFFIFVIGNALEIEIEHVDKSKKHYMIMIVVMAI